MMMRQRRRRIDPAWESSADQALVRFPHLDEDMRERLLEQAREFDRTRSWEALDGITLTPSMRAAISAPACVLTVNIGLEHFSDVSAILVERASAVRPTRHVVGGGIVSEGSGRILGQALVHGPVRIAWDEVERELTASGRSSVVIHEFAHKIDMADGVVDGTPTIRSWTGAREFEAVLDQVLTDIRDGNGAGPLRPYGATSRSELFAVATEAFFLAARELEHEIPHLYAVLAAFYQQDPADSDR